MRSPRPDPRLLASIPARVLDPPGLARAPIAACLMDSLAGGRDTGLAGLRIYQGHTEVFDAEAVLVPGSTYCFVPRLRGGMMIKVCRLPTCTGTMFRRGMRQV